MDRAARAAVAVARRRPESAVALAAAVYMACAAWGWFGHTAALVVGNVFMIGLPVTGGLLAVDVGRRLRGRARTSWVLCGLSGIFWAAGQATYAVYDFVLRVPPPLPGPPDACYLLALGMLTVGVVTLPAAPRHATSHLWLVLDAVLVSTALFVISWVLVLRPLWEEGASSLLASAVALAYPSGDVIVGALAILTMLRRREGGGRAQYLLLSGIGALFLADVAYGVLSFSGAYVTGAPVDVGWWGGYLLIGLAARAFRPGSHLPAERPLPGWVMALPNLVFLPMIVVVVWAYFAGRLGGVVVVAAATGTAALVVRQALVNRDHARLAGELVQRETHYRHLAHHDHLTGLANRAHLRQDLEDALRAGRDSALVVLDLDGFKQVNDTLGHEAGDAVLLAVSRRLEKVLRPGDLVARLGGDEFAVLPEPGSDVDGLAERLRSAISGAYTVGGTEVTLGASVGVAGGEPGAGPDELLRNADFAMYCAKRGGRGRVSRYEPALHADAVSRLGMESALRGALRRGELRLDYQPILDLPADRPVGAEALLRWERPGFGLLYPGDFLEVAESTGLIVEIGDWVIHEGCRQLAAWREAGLELALGINVSTQQIHESDLVSTLVHALEETGVPADRIVVEITESVLLGDLDHAVSVLRRLRALGVHLALDDFGTGYSSLSYLHRLPVDILKIDGSFVAGLLHAPEHRVLVDTVVTLGRKLGLDLVAEGVESPRQADELRGMGVTFAQGHLFSPPVPADDLPGAFAALLARAVPLAG